MTALTFEDRLLEQLRSVVAAQPAPVARPRRRRLAVTGVGAAAAASAVAVVAIVGTNSEDAYAVRSLPDGGVSVSIRSLSDAAGLQQRLRAEGVPAVVDYVPADERGCTAPSSAPAPPGAETLVESGGAGLSQSGPTETRQAPEGSPKGIGRAKVMSSVRTGGDGVTFTIDPGTVAPGEKVYITTSTGAISSIGIAISTEKPTGGCVTQARTGSPGRR